MIIYLVFGQKICGYEKSYLKIENFKSQEKTIRR